MARSQGRGLIVSGMWTQPVPMTMTFGGVPTGDMNAQFTAMAAMRLADRRSF